ncbi:MAG: VOC family protein [Muribaculaceae bacterium]|nr:VOC family protein [Muribaculaceae bacterium]
MIAFFEIPTNDFNKSVAFYQTLFGEQLALSEYGDEKMACFMKDGKSIGSISSTPCLKGFVPSNGGVLVYFTTTNLENTVKSAIENDATLVTPKTKIQVEGWGYFAIIEDPVGNRIGLYGEN